MLASLALFFGLLLTLYAFDAVDKARRAPLPRVEPPHARRDVRARRLVEAMLACAKGERAKR